MPKLKILTWHVHGSYLNTLATLDHEIYIPVGGRYGGSGDTSFEQHKRLHEVPMERVRDLSLDLILYQHPDNYEKDQYDIFTDAQLRLPRIYLEHNTPQPHPTASRHPVDDPNVLLVHVTHFNRLMWDNGRTPTMVIEHSVAVDPGARYSGELAKGITVVNGIKQRGRATGFDLLVQAREQIPIDVCGLQTEEYGLGPIPYRDLPHFTAAYRFLFSPMRHTSLPLAVIEAMFVGLPVVTLATTELPTVIEHGRTGFLSCEIDELIEHMRWLLDHPAEAREMGARARAVAEKRFNLDRFARDWDAAFAKARAIQ